MSTLSVSNITDGTTTVGTSYVVNGSARAWVNFNGTGTVAIRDSTGISSISDVATGKYICSFASSMANATYVATVNTNASADPVPTAVVIVRNEASSDYQVTSTDQSLNDPNAANKDYNVYFSLIHGDLA